MDGGRWPRDVVALLVSLSALLVYFQYTALEKFGVLSPSVGCVTLHDFILTVQHAIPLDGGDAATALLIFAAFTSLVAMEVRRRRLSIFFDAVFQNETRTLAAVTLFSLVAVRFYFARGELTWAADSSMHIGYAWVAARAFAEGELPIWTNVFCAGSPFLQFYGFLFYYLVGLTNLVFQDLFFSIKIVMAAAHVLSGIGAYLFVRSLCQSRPAGFVAAICFVLTFWHTQQIVVMGRLPLSVFYGLLPWPFYFFERLRTVGASLPSVVAGAATLGLLAFTHPGYAFWATGLLAGYMAIRLWTGRNQVSLASITPRCLLLVGGGLVLGAYLTLPMWVERIHTGLRFGLSMSDMPDPDWKRLLVWSNYRFPIIPVETTHWYGGYLGVSLVLLSIVGLAAAFAFRGRIKSPASRAGALCLLASLLLVFGYRWPVLRDLSVVQAFNSARYLLFVAFFGSVMAGVGAAALLRLRNQASWPTPVFTALMLVIAVDLGSTTFQHPCSHEGPRMISRQAHTDLRMESNRFTDGELPNYRVFHTTERVYRAKILSWFPLRTGMVPFLGSFNEQPLAMVALGKPIEAFLNPLIDGMRDPRALNESEAFDLIVSGLYQLNTKHVFALQSDDTGGAWRSVSWSLPEASPVVVSPRIEGWRLDLDPDPGRALEAATGLLQAMNLNPLTGTCERILLTDYEGAEDLGTRPVVQVLEHHVWNQRVEMRLHVSAPCFARLSYAHYPHLDVTVDGRPVEPYQTADRFIALRLESGEHSIVLVPRLSPLRRALLALNLVLATAVVAVLVRARHRRKRTGEPSSKVSGR